MNKRLSEELTVRKRLRQHLDYITGPKPRALGVRNVQMDWSSDVFDELYQSLNSLLGTGLNDRFVLYCPFDIIPTADSYRKYYESLDEFAELYIRSWYRLLNVHDVRANFIDGDVPDIELEQRPMDMVVQAAYLVPMLLEKGLLTNLQLYALYNQDEVRTRSFDDALRHHEVVKFRIDDNAINSSVSLILRDHDNYINLIIKQFSASDKRAGWLRHSRRQLVIKKLGQALVPYFMVDRPPNLDNKYVEIAAISATIETAAVYSLCSAQLIFSKYKEYLIGLMNTEFHDVVTSVLCRLYNFDVIPVEVLIEANIFVPSLCGPFYSNLKVVEFDRSALFDSELADIIYPVWIVYGSRLKGYGDLNSDIDKAVFVRPGVTDIDKVNRLLLSKFGNVTRFWLDEVGQDLRVRDFEKPEAYLGSSTDSHVLFGGVWEGDRDCIRMLGVRLLVPYTNADGNTRRVMLEELERDLLLYRLLHRGYEKYYMTDGPTFLDDGYRMMAARIYTSHVYVP